MKALLVIGGIVIITIIYWYSSNSNEKDITISGFLTVKPKVGYVWRETETTQSKFWGGTTKWNAGAPHPEYSHVVAGSYPDRWDAVLGYQFISTSSLVTKWVPNTGYFQLHMKTSNQEGVWEPYPGYILNQGNKFPVAVWTSGLLHPEYKAVSSETVGNWDPFPGYGFKAENTLLRGLLAFNQKQKTMADFVWLPYSILPDEKLITTENELEYIAFPGYDFLSGNTIEVEWKPGMRNYNYPDSVASQTEGEWYYSERPTARETGWGRIGVVLLGGLINSGVKKVVGENTVSDQADEELAKQGLRGVFEVATNTSSDNPSNPTPIKKRYVWNP